MNKINTLINSLHNHDIGLLLIRLAVGITFVMAGWFKLNNIDMVIEGFGKMGLVPIFAYIVSLVEFLGGIAMILGIAVRYAGILISIVMIVAIVKVHLPMGYSLQNNGYEYVLVLLLAALAVTTLGAGKYSLTHWWTNRAMTRSMF